MSVDCGSNCTNYKTQICVSVVPWYSVAQFKKVYEYLYSSEIVKKRWAIDQISVWDSRCEPSLPTAVEASSVLSRAMIQDILLTNGASLCQERDIQMMYSMALVRFVNLTVESHQKQTGFSTIIQTAKGLGIPSWVVDLRNEATHSFLPSLPSLRMAAETAMKYLSESYWEKEISTLKNLIKKPEDEIETRDLIRSYITKQFHIINNKKRQIPTAQYAQLIAEFNSLIRKIHLCVYHNKQHFINVLVSDGLFIPFDEDLRNIMATSSGCLPYEEVCDENVSATKSIPPIPSDLLNLWKRMLQVLHTHQAIPLLLEELLKSQADRTEMGKKLVISWVQKILKICSLGIEDVSLKKVFKKKCGVIYWCRLFDAAVSRPCLYVLYILPMIFSHIKLSEKVSRYVLSLLAILLGQGDWETVELDKNHSIYSVEKLKKMKQLQDVQKSKNKSCDECIWRKAKSVVGTIYESWPLGFVNNPTDDDDQSEQQSEDSICLEDFDEKMDEKYFFGNENDNVEEYFEINNEPSCFEDDDVKELCERQTFLYKKK